MNTVEQLIFTFFSQDGYVVINKSVLKALSGRAVDALLLSNLITFYRHIQKNSSSESDGWFFQTTYAIEKDLGIKEYAQRKALERLEAQGFLQQKRAGVPPKRYIKLNMDAIYNFIILSQKSESLPRVDSKKKFYDTLNKNIFSKSLSDFLKEIDHLDPEFAKVLFYLSRGMKKYKGIELIWNSRSLGELLTWYKKYKKPVPGNLLLDIISVLPDYPKGSFIREFINQTKLYIDRPSDQTFPLEQLDQYFL